MESFNQLLYTAVGMLFCLIVLIGILGFIYILFQGSNCLTEEETEEIEKFVEDHKKHIEAVNNGNNGKANS